MWIAELSITVFKQSPWGQLDFDQTSFYFGHLPNILMHRSRQQLFVRGWFQIRILIYVKDCCLLKKHFVFKQYINAITAKQIMVNKLYWPQFSLFLSYDRSTLNQGICLFLLIHILVWRHGKKLETIQWKIKYCRL